MNWFNKTFRSVRAKVDPVGASKARYERISKEGSLDNAVKTRCGSYKNTYTRCVESTAKRYKDSMGEHMARAATTLTNQNKRRNDAVAGNNHRIHIENMRRKQIEASRGATNHMRHSRNQLRKKEADIKEQGRLITAANANKAAADKERAKIERQVVELAHYNNKKAAADKSRAYIRMMELV